MWNGGEPSNHNPILEVWEDHLELHNGGFNDAVSDIKQTFLCSADPCIGTSDPSDDGSDGNLYCINGGSIGGATPIEEANPLPCT